MEIRNYQDINLAYFQSTYAAICEHDPRGIISIRFHRFPVSLAIGPGGSPSQNHSFCSAKSKQFLRCHWNHFYFRFFLQSLGGEVPPGEGEEDTY